MYSPGYNTSQPRVITHLKPTRILPIYTSTSQSRMFGRRNRSQKDRFQNIYVFLHLSVLVFTPFHLCICFPFLFLVSRRFSPSFKSLSICCLLALTFAVLISHSTPSTFYFPLFNAISFPTSSVDKHIWSAYVCYVCMWV